MLHSLKQQTVVLASASPRRRQLLERFGISFVVQPSQVDESVDLEYSPARMVELLAERKAQKISEDFQEGLIIGCDTIVVLDGEVLGKPTDEQEAYAMLMKLSGREHSVFSGLVVIDAANQTKKIGFTETKVKIKLLSEKEIKKYIATGEPMDKAGAYAIQGFGSLFVEEIHGDFYSVVGLPLRLLANFLEQFGVTIWGE